MLCLQCKDRVPNSLADFVMLSPDFWVVDLVSKIYCRGLADIFRQYFLRWKSGFYVYVSCFSAAAQLQLWLRVTLLTM